MVSLIAAPTHFRLPRPRFIAVNSASVFGVFPATRWALVGVRQNLIRGSQFVCSGGVLRRCRVGESEDNSGLEQEVLEFMLESENPDKFPSRKELIEAGRRDLADAVLRRGGWMTRGWDLVSDDDSEGNEVDAPVESGFEINGVGNSEVKRPEIRLAEVKELEANGACAPCDDSHSPASSSGRAVETAADRDSGIEGILSGLERHRNLSLGLDVKRKDSYPRKDGEAMLSQDNPRRVTNKTSMSKLNGVRSSLKPDTWRTWSIQRAGVSNSQFEAAEIDFDDSGKVRPPDPPTDQIIALKRRNKEELSETIKDLKSGGKYNGDKIKSRLQNLELELSSALYLLRSNTDDISQKVDHERLPEDSRNLSDDWEFKENEIMKAQDKVRSLRARFAVLEGKVALTKIDTQKVIDEKQKRINDARKALQRLRSTCVVWPNSASEVLLTGSFDGWATQKKMEKFNNGNFCLWLRLYPGRYEIKFIVDGVWKIDPLRPIVNNGNENNLLIIS